MKIFHVFIKDLKILTKDRGTYISLFVLPLMFSIVLTLALGGVFGGGTSDSPVTIPVVASSSNASSTAKLIEKIPGITWKRTKKADAKEQVESSRALGALLISDNGADVTFYEDPAQATNAGLVFGQIQAYVTAATLAGQTNALQIAVEKNASPQLNDHVQDIMTSSAITMTSKAAQQSDSAIQPTAAEQYIPGFTVAFLFFIATTIAQYMFMEKERGTLRRLLTSPVRRYSILLGKLLPNVLIGFGQVAVIFAVGFFMFNMHLGNLGALLVVTCAAVAAANGFGLMITALSKTQAQATGLATLLVFTLATVAGCYVPLSFMPDFMQNIAMATPQGWVMTAYQAIIIKGADIAQVMQNTLVLCGFAVVFFLVGLSRFRFTEKA